MNNVLWGAVCAADYSIPLNHEEAHPAYTEGYYSYQPWKVSYKSPYEETTDSWYEWQDGFGQAKHNFMTREL